MTYDFDTPVDIRGTGSFQWDVLPAAYGVPDLIPFTISDMDFRSPPEVLEALQRRIARGVFGYTDWRYTGFPEAVRDWYGARHGVAVDPEALVYGPSVVNELAQLLRIWTRPGDGVVVHTPTYDGFIKALTGLGRELRGVPVGDAEALERELARPDSRVLLLCSPHNPTGRVWTETELKGFAALAEAHGAAVISDEIHADLAHDGHRHVPWLSVARPGGRWALITSASKAFNFPALTGAYGVIGDPDDRAAFVGRMERGEGLGSPAALALTAHVAAYRHGAAWLDQLRGYVVGNLRLLADRLEDAFPGRALYAPPQAGYLAWLDLRPLGVDDEALNDALIADERVAVRPGAVYGAKGHVRVNLGCPRAKAERGIDALTRTLTRLAS
ncbi:MalY/PatB family protein [Streptomyces sp. TRM49041]|uniref:MalY/PatB family protein n=1 Tax=Streptomyces sp. TRM49041 TaxID=2603216 RepID=UPI0011EF4B28|nr:aminotransferase class I/II-fold pyridoxal phosphate-dependent enzyme [Streptomyces sp. TRM49041]